MKVITLAVDKIIPYENNPRNNDEAVPYVANSIKEFGFKVPIILDKDNVIIAGHTRLKAAISLGMETVPCVIAEDLDDEKIKAFRLADNKVSELAEWNIKLLEAELESLDPELMLDFGFEDFFEDNIEIIEDDFDVEEALENETNIELGDIYQLGEHRLMCGDSTDKESVEFLMNEKTADMVFTDPPYGIDYLGARTQVIKSRDYGKIKNDTLAGEDLGHLISQVFNFVQGDVYICVSPIMQKPFLDYLEKINKEVNAVIVWDKKNAGLGLMSYRRQCEFILFIKHKTFKKGDPQDFDLWSISREKATDYVHGTQKPIGVPSRAIRNSSKKSDIVLDLFGGSGSTLIACEELKRKCYMMELDPKYCDVIIKRWEKLTGEKAIKLN